MNNRLSQISIVVNIVLGVVVILLMVQNRDLKFQRISSNFLKPLQQGDIVEAFKVLSINGDTLNFNYTQPNQKYLFFILSTTCPHCKNNLIHWNNIVNYVKRDDVYSLGISLNNNSETFRYFNEKNVKFYICTIADTNFTNKYKIAGVPETILVDGNGVVEKVWIGELGKEQETEITDLLSTSFSQYHR